jgi:hypothetical protein
MTRLPYDIPRDIWYVIFSFLSYPERAVCLRLSRSMMGLTIDHFSNIAFETITWPGRPDPSYLIVHHPYSSPCLHAKTYLGHHYLSIILYDTPTSYFYLRYMGPHEQGKTLQTYLSEYHHHTTGHRNHIRHILGSTT